MDTNWKRPKVIESETPLIKTNCGGLYVILGKEDGKLIEVSATIGKGGTCSNYQLINFCKVISMYLQSPEPRYKIAEKFKKQFASLKDKDTGCGQGKFFHEKEEYQSCEDYIVKRVIKELDV